MRKIAKKLSVLFVGVIMAVASIMLSACGDDAPKYPEGTKPPESVSIENTDLKLGAGTHLLTAKVSPDDASQDVVFSLADTVTGISLDKNILTVGGEAKQDDKFTVNVASAYNAQITSSKEFSVDLEKSVEPESVSFIAPPRELPVGEHTLLTTIAPANADQQVTLSLAEAVNGITINGNKLTIAQNTLHDTTFSVKATSVAKSSVTTTFEFIVNNPLPAEGVEITNTETHLGVGEHKLTATVSPVGSSQKVIYELEETLEGVAVINDKVIITEDAENDAPFTVRVYSVFDNEVTVTKDFTVHNPPPPAIVINNKITALNYSVYSMRNFQLDYTLVELTGDVIFEVVDNPAGVSVSEEGFVTLSRNVTDGSEFTIKATSDADNTISATMTFSVVNKLDPDSDNWIDIGTKEQLYALAERNDPSILTNNYRLTADIDVGGIWEASIGFGLGADADKTFNGYFDGNGYKITNFGGSYTKGRPLFWNLGKNAVVRNLEISTNSVGSNFNGGSAAVIACSNAGLIYNVSLSGHLGIVNGLGSEIGGFVIMNTGVIADSFSQMTIKAHYADTVVKNAAIARYLGPDDTFVGLITNVVVDKDVTGSETALVYKTEYDSCLKTTEEAKNVETYDSFDPERWNIEADSYPQMLETKYPNIKITNKDAMIDVEGTSTYQITYTIENTDETAVAFKLETPVKGVSVDAKGLVSFTDEVVGGSKFTVVIELSNNTKIRASKSFVINKIESFEGWTKIATKADLLKLTVNDEAILAGKYILTADIDLGADAWNTSIGGATRDGKGGVFTGKFDGQGHTISNFGGGYQMGVPMFYEIGEGATVSNLGLDSNNQGSNFNCMYAAMVALINKGTISNVSLSGHLGVVNQNQDGQIAAFVRDNNGTIANCISTLTLKYAYANTVAKTCAIAVNNNGTISNVFVDKEVTGATNALAGANETLDAMLLTTADMKKAATYVERYEALDGDLKTANDFMNLYGFTFNSIANVKDYVHIRKHHNYVKAQLQGITGNISNTARDDLRQRFAQGVRFWNQDEISYEYENYELWLED